MRLHISTQGKDGKVKMIQLEGKEESQNVVSKSTGGFLSIYVKVYLNLVELISVNEV